MSDGRNSSVLAVKVIKNKQRNCNLPQNLFPTRQESSNPGRLGLSPPVENSNPHGFEDSTPVESLTLDRVTFSTGGESRDLDGVVFSTTVESSDPSRLKVSTGDNYCFLLFSSHYLLHLNIIRILGQFYSFKMFVL